jgi:hypothetical protein
MTPKSTERSTFSSSPKGAPEIGAASNADATFSSSIASGILCPPKCMIGRVQSAIEHMISNLVTFVKTVCSALCERH